VTRLVVDASVALKWIVAEPGSAEAASLRAAERLLAPDLIMAECANVIWKLARRGEVTEDFARTAARVFEQAELELHPMRGLIAEATRMAILLDHPAYDAFYLALAKAERCALVTADDRLIRKVLASPDVTEVEVLTIADAAARVVAINSQS
jgi:predicted nucleic acid-binding protein